MRYRLALVPLPPVEEQQYRGISMRKIILAAFVSLILVPSVATLALAGTRADPHGSPGAGGQSGDGGGKRFTTSPDPADPRSGPHDGFVPPA